MSRTCKPRSMPGEKPAKVRLENRRYFEQLRAMSRLALDASAEPPDRPEPPECGCERCGAKYRPVRYRRLLEAGPPVHEVVKEFSTVAIFRRDRYCETCRQHFALYRLFRRRGMSKTAAAQEAAKFPTTPRGEK